MIPTFATTIAYLAAHQLTAARYPDADSRDKAPQSIRTAYVTGALLCQLLRSILTPPKYSILTAGIQRAYRAKKKQTVSPLPNECELSVHYLLSVCLNAGVNKGSRQALGLTLDSRSFGSLDIWLKASRLCNETEPEALSHPSSYSLDNIHTHTHTVVSLDRTVASGIVCYP